MRFDLHSHSSASDGKLSSHALIDMAVKQDLKLFALTDHDTIEGFIALKSTDWPLTLISGVEFSCRWQNQPIHIVGLDFDETSPALQAMLERQAIVRAERAKKIGVKLAQQGFTEAYAGALALAQDEFSIGRPHFAHYLVSIGKVKSLPQAFKRYLGKGKVADVKADWPDLAEIVSCINTAAGVAVLAHPLKYAMTLTKLKQLIVSFSSLGGVAVEAVDVDQKPKQQQWLYQLLADNNLAISAGSDFHDPSGYPVLGRVPCLPSSLDPIWQKFKRTTQFRAD